VMEYWMNTAKECWRHAGLKSQRRVASSTRSRLSAPLHGSLFQSNYTDSAGSRE